MHFNILSLNSLCPICNINLNLVFLSDAVQSVLDAGGSLQDAYQIDQSAYKHWHTYDELAARNAGRVFERMEFE